MTGKAIRVVEGNAKPYEPFWQVRNATETGGDPEIDFIGYISEYSWLGDEITPKKFKDDLYAAGKGGPITIRMHSGGGEIFAAAAIRAMLLEYPGRKTVSINGLAASAAVAIALAGDVVKIYDTSYMMVHNPGYGGLMGYLDADTLQKFADELRLFREGIISGYQTRTGLNREKLAEMMDAETWMTGAQAVELGFADELVTGGKPVQQDPTIQNYVNVPAALLNISGQAPAVKVYLQEAQVRLEQKKEFAYQGETSIMTVTIRELLKQRENLVQRATEITATADAEKRDLNEAERAEFQEILGMGDEPGKVGALDAQITQIEAERARLKEAAEKKFSNADPVKPTGQPLTSMKRADFDKLPTNERVAFMKSGGKIQD
jgi:ATP-dependent protease ClpP protease subunit